MRELCLNLLKANQTTAKLITAEEAVSFWRCFRAFFSSSINTTSLLLSRYSFILSAKRISILSSDDTPQCPDDTPLSTEEFTQTDRFCLDLRKMMEEIRDPRREKKKRDAVAAAPTPPPPPLALIPDRNGVSGSASKQPLSCSNLSKGAFLRFYVELRHNDTTVVSLRKLVKDFHKEDELHDNNVNNSVSQPAIAAHPALAGRIAAENDVLPPPANRFSAVIEKIERLYKGNSSDDDLEDAPDDEQYDTEDSFIDDEELDEYFTVDALKPKHTGFFINRGKLEQVREDPSPVQAPKKRKKREVKLDFLEKGHEEKPNKLFKSGGQRLKAAARGAPMAGTDQTTCDDIILYSGKADKNSESRAIRNETGSLVSPGLKLNRPVQKFKELKHVSVNSLHNNLPKAQQEFKERIKMKSSGAVDSRDSLNTREITVGSNEIGSRDSQHTLALFAHYKTTKNNNDITPVAGSSKLRTVDRFPQSTGLHEISSSSRLPPSKPGLHENSSSSKFLSSKTERVGLKSIKRNKSLSLSASKDDSHGKPKISALERAFQELANSVRECKFQDQDQLTQGVKRRIPALVKLKLAKAAKIAEVQGKLSKEFVDRIMSILGHSIGIRTVKRHLKGMIGHAQPDKQEKEQKFRHLKEEVVKLVNMQVACIKSKSPEQLEGSSDDFQGQPESSVRYQINNRYKWDRATEDRICELFDQYFEGDLERTHSKLESFYTELSDIWPKGWIEKNDIRKAIARAKSRKKRHNKTPDDGMSIPEKAKLSEQNGSSKATVESGGTFQMGIANTVSNKTELAQGMSYSVHPTQQNILSSKATQIL